MYTLLYAFYARAYAYASTCMAWRPSAVPQYRCRVPPHRCTSVPKQHLCGTSAPLHLCLQVAAHRRAQQLATQLQQSFKNAPVIPLDWRPADMEAEVAVVAYPQPQP